MALLANPECLLGPWVLLWRSRENSIPFPVCQGGGRRRRDRAEGAALVVSAGLGTLRT